MGKSRSPSKKRRIPSSCLPKAPADPPPLHCGVFTLDQRTLRATKGDGQLTLTPMQTRLFLLFMRHAGRVIRRKTIIKEIWKTEYEEDVRMLYVHICGLRQKIEDDPRHPAYLRTVRGIGYRFGMPGEETAPAI